MKRSSEETRLEERIDRREKKEFVKVFEQEGRGRVDRDVGWEELRGKIEVLLKREK